MMDNKDLIKLLEDCERYFKSDCGYEIAYMCRLAIEHLQSVEDAEHD